jgi:hypothetical protein
MITETTVLDLWPVRRRLHLMHQEHFLKCVCSGSILHKMPIQFSTISHLVKEGGQNQPHITVRTYCCVKIHSYPLCELYFLPVHTEEPKDVMTSSGLLLIKHQCHQVFLQSVRLFQNFVSSSTDPIGHNFIMIF